MSVEFDVVIDSPDGLSVDMQTGLQTLQGVSDAVRSISQAILDEGSVPERLTHASNVRTSLMETFEGSYGQVFSLELFNEELNRELQVIGKPVFAELISYFLNDALYQTKDVVSPKAQEVLKRLNDKSEAISQQLRKSILVKIHKVPSIFGYEVKIRHRLGNHRKILGEFTQETAKVLVAKESRDRVNLRVSITRLNINTGNGRFLIEGATEIVAFGFGSGYKFIAAPAKKKISENLSYNNTVASEAWRVLEIAATKIERRDGKILKYIIKEVHGD
tara:strand:- start:1027 stop:1854 length:828 start_codon:yes stop_codon:yes gene_type:complete